MNIDKIFDDIKSDYNYKNKKHNHSLKISKYMELSKNLSNCNFIILVLYSIIHKKFIKDYLGKMYNDKIFLKNIAVKILADEYDEDNTIRQILTNKIRSLNNFQLFEFKKISLNENV
jgi:hypothetical protein